MATITPIDPLSPAVETIDAAARIMHSGGVVIFPTRCLYGLGVDAFNTDAVARLFALKQRPESNPILVLIPDPGALSQVVASIPPVAERLIQAFWPGRMTIVMKAAEGIPAVLTAGTGKIGVRMPGHPVAAALVKAAGRPITGTSANISGQPGSCRVSELPESLISGVDCILDVGSLRGGVGSTVVDVTEKKMRILREGAVSASEIKKIRSHTG